ncbi:MAG: hypothetical protein HZC10_09265 [Nitrospirae bacterium]|nr:hypothetical protein [Nitrospirota bacterium]
MAKEERRILTEEEKQDLLAKHKNCYICLESLEGYSREEIHFDHIYNYADGYLQDLSNFAPVHTSKDERKLNCHAAKGRKAPIEYREEVRIKKRLKAVQGLADLCPSAFLPIIQPFLRVHQIGGRSQDLKRQQVLRQPLLDWQCRLRLNDRRHAIDLETRRRGIFHG